MFVNWEPHNTSRSTPHSLVAFRSLLLERPIGAALTSSHVWIVTTSPVLVFAVITICGSGREGAGDVSECSVNAFSLPPVEQYFRCAKDAGENSCKIVCLSFWNSDTCRSDDKVKETLSASAAAGTNSPNRGTSILPWHVQHTLTNGTSPGPCVTANSSYLPFRVDRVSGTYLPAGTRLAKLYSACVPTISARGGEGDGMDNDCDGTVDEEEENMADDDGDDKIDEDTYSDCGNEATSRQVRSGGLRKAVVDPGSAPPPPLSWPFTDYEGEESEMPLFAVIISLTVAIVAVVGVISVFLLMELMSRRRQIRNTKIRPFVS